MSTTCRFLTANQHNRAIQYHSNTWNTAWSCNEENIFGQPAWAPWSAGGPLQLQGQ